MTGRQHVGRLAVLAVCVAVLNHGCIEFLQLIQGTLPPFPNGSPPEHDGDGGTNGTDGDESLAVRLVVSNPNPQVSDSFVEEVFLQCEVISGNAAGLTYQFQDPTGRLDVDQVLGTASFIPDASDVGQTFVFTCTATSEGGASAVSGEQIVIPTA